jgi:hypothetical protein
MFNKKMFLRFRIFAKSPSKMEGRRIGMKNGVAVVRDNIKQGLDGKTSQYNTKESWKNSVSTEFSCLTLLLYVISS